MKVLHDKGIFSIEGITVINPEVLTGYVFTQPSFAQYEKEIYFDLPDNIIAERVIERIGEPGYRYPKVTGYRLKLKEPLVDISPIDEQKTGIKKLNAEEGIEFIKSKFEKPLEDTGSKETQDQIFDDIFSRYFQYLHDGFSMNDAVKELENNFTITRK